MSSPSKQRMSSSRPDQGPRDHQHQLTVKKSIQTRFIALMLALTTISVLTISYLETRAVQNIGQRAQRISAEALRTQAEEYLRQVTTGDVQKNELILREIQLDALKVAQYTADIFERSETLADQDYWRAADRMFTASDGQYMNDETDISSAFVPNSAVIDDELVADLNASAYLDFILPPIYESDPNTVAIYLGTEKEMVRYYPNINLGSVVSPDFEVTQRPWYTRAAPEENPGRTVVWSPVYVDATGKGLLVTAAAPVYSSQGEFIGVVGIDVTLTNISAGVRATRLLGSGYSFLIDETGHSIALPRQGYQDLLGRAPEPEEVRTDVNNPNAEFASILENMVAQEKGFDTLTVEENELFIAYAPLESTGWSLANVVEAEGVLQAARDLQEELDASTRSLLLTRILPIGAIVLIVVTAIGYLLTKRLAEPIRKIAEAAHQIGAGQWDVQLPQAGDDEIGVLSQAFATMIDQLRELLTGLEQWGAERTLDLQRRSIQLDAAAQVAREAAAIHDVQKLLDEAVRLISERFGFYHAGIFLLDETKSYALLQAASSEGGQRMLARSHKLKIGEVGIVGHVGSSGKPRIALDVGEDAVFFDNPDLPQTRSEIALPLKVRGQVIGVLDVQSKEASAFSDEDMEILQTLGDQLALAIENARLLEKAEQRLLEVNTLLGRHSQEGWEQLSAERPSWGYIYDGIEVRPQEDVRSTDDDHQLTVPFRVRGRVIGHVNIAMPGRPPTPEEEDVVRDVIVQASLALENARLYQDTQRRAARERLVGQVTAHMRETLDIEMVMQTAAREIRDAMGLHDVTIQLKALDDRL